MAGEQEKQLDELLNQAGVSEEITRVIKQGGLISISLFARAVPTAESLEEYLLEIGEALGRTDNKLRRVEQAAVRIAYDAALGHHEMDRKRKAEASITGPPPSEYESKYMQCRDMFFDAMMYRPAANQSPYRPTFQKLAPLIASGTHEAITFREIHSDGDGQKSKRKVRRLEGDGVEHEREELSDARILDKDVLVDKLWTWFHTVLMCSTDTRW